MGVLALRRLYQLVDDVLGRRLIRIAHPEIDDVLTPGSGGLLQFTYDIEDIRRQTLDTGKIGSHDSSRGESGPNAGPTGRKMRAAI